MQWSDGWLYVATGEGGRVLKMLPNGKESSPIETEDGLPIVATDFIVYKDWIYFESRSDEFDQHYIGSTSNEYNYIFKMKVDGTNLEWLTTGDLILYADEGPYLYYMYREPEEMNQLIRMNLDNGSITVIYEGKRYFYVGNQVGDNVFFLDWSSDLEEQTVIYYGKMEEDSLEVFGGKL